MYLIVIANIDRISRSELLLLSRHSSLSAIRHTVITSLSGLSVTLSFLLLLSSPLSLLLLSSVLFSCPRCSSPSSSSLSRSPLHLSQHLWWCALCIPLPLTALPPSCVSTPATWAERPCVEKLEGWTETGPTSACTGPDLSVHTHTHTQSHKSQCR